MIDYDKRVVIYIVADHTKNNKLAPLLYEPKDIFLRLLHNYAEVIE